MQLKARQRRQGRPRRQGACSTSPGTCMGPDSMAKHSYFVVNQSVFPLNLPSNTIYSQKIRANVAAGGGAGAPVIKLADMYRNHLAARLVQRRAVLRELVGAGRKHIGPDYQSGKKCVI